MRDRPRETTVSRAGRRGPELAVRTIAFADIVGSTALADAGELEAFRRVSRVLATLRQLAREMRGRIVQEAGDGALACFMEVDDAVAWAARCHDAVSRQRRDPGTRVGTKLRIGVHVGPVLLFGRRVFGRTVTIACRLQQAAEMDETLISSNVYEAYRGDSWGGTLARAGDLLIKGTTIRLATCRIRPQVAVRVCDSRPTASPYPTLPIPDDGTRAQVKGAA